MDFLMKILTHNPIKLTTSKYFKAHH